MEKVTMAKGAGIVLAIHFALVIGISMWALLIGDYMNSVMNPQAQQSLRIVGFAGALSALATWWVQGFAAKRGFVVRVLFALFIFVVASAALAAGTIDAVLFTAIIASVAVTIAASSIAVRFIGAPKPPVPS